MRTVSGIWDENNSDQGWKKDGSGLRDKHPGSATLDGIHKKVTQ
jgi:hypothetical protein